MEINSQKGNTLTVVLIVTIIVVLGLYTVAITSFNSAKKAEQGVAPTEILESEEDIGPCQNECSVFGLQECIGEQDFHICSHDVNECLIWSPDISCPLETKCLGGICTIENAEGSTREPIEDFHQCSAGLCCDFNTRKFKTSNYVCHNKAGIEYGCPWGTDEGNDVGIRYQDRYCSGDSADCIGKLKLRDWQVYKSCSMDEACENGKCASIETCQSECPTSGIKQCFGNGYKTCEDNNGDGCLEWSSVASCGSDKICTGGECVDELLEECDSYVQVSDTIIFREKYSGEILSEGNILYDKFREQFYQTHEDRYDFIILFPTDGMQSMGLRSHAIKVNHDISGIGSSLARSDLYSNKLKSMAMMNFYQMWSLLDSELHKDLLDSIVHEIGHHWCCYLEEVIPSSEILHWPYNVDLFNGDTDYLDVMTYNSWIRNDSQETCVYEALPLFPKNRSFSNLTLYLMGLIPEKEVGPIYLHEFEETDDPLYNKWGPTCFDEHEFTDTKKVAISDIVEAHGERIPKYEESQKDFTIAFIILTDKDMDISSEFIDYVDQYKEALPEAWCEATNGKSEISF
ncbi:MAG: hypothetical protein U9Q96_02325 [Patescibacteria group bacterium]|nr:hypothetical protein [Patescibacteria group bacterium]